MAIQIKRFLENPLLVPDPNYPWMSKNIFNCGVVIDDGLFKMLFRGAGTGDQSMSDLGRALSADGIKWERFNKPALRCNFNDHCDRGVEDPRIVKWIDGWWYIFATAYSFTAEIRAGIWRTKDFSEYEWVGIPFANREDKNSSILSEPIEGSAYLIHRHPPHIWMSTTDDMSLKTGWQDSQILIDKDKFYPHPKYDVYPLKIGLAGPPVKAPKGWLVITHVVHQVGENIWYSLGFAVLDLKNPREVIYLHPAPILWPEEKYEKNIVFSCATIDPGGDTLYVYWGGADEVICGGQLFKEDLPQCY